jgi:hypothetical protein
MATGAVTSQPKDDAVENKIPQVLFTAGNNLLIVSAKAESGNVCLLLIILNSGKALEKQ